MKIKAFNNYAYIKFSLKPSSADLKNSFTETTENSVYLQKANLSPVLNDHVIYCCTPNNLVYAWSFGFLAGISLVIQIISGVFLAIYYMPNIDLAFASVEFIMRDVNYGWLVLYVHSNGTSMFFIVVYFHILRGLYYGSYTKPRVLLWVSGVVLLPLIMTTAFLGSLLPWGQMSFWGAIAITNMVNTIPEFGPFIVEWLWNDFTVNNNPTLNRFFALHFFFTFVIVGVVFLHLILLNKDDGSSAPITDSTGVDKISFYPYFFVNDFLFVFSCYLLIFAVLVLYYPNLLGDPTNYIPADSFHIPRHIVPEWYFLPFYAILRSIPHKAGGIVTMIFSLLVLFVLPFINTSVVKDSSSRMLFKICFFAAVADFLLLGWLGQSPVKDGYILVGQAATVYYFVFFLILLPFADTLEAYWIYHRSKN